MYMPTEIFFFNERIHQFAHNHVRLKKYTVFSGFQDATFLFLKPLLKAGATYAPVRPFYGFQLGRGQLEKI